MKSRRLILLAAALLLAASTAMVARALMRPPPPVTIVKQVPMAQPQKRLVLAAQRDLQPGEFLDSSALRWQELPVNALHAQHLQAQAETEQRQIEREVHGATLRRPLAVGDPLTRELLVYPGQPGFLAAVLAPGMRAVSIPTSAIASNAGLVNAGDRVDVILSLDRDTLPSTPERPDGSFAMLAAQTIVRDVRVLALNNSTDSIAPSSGNEKPDVNHAKQANNNRIRYQSMTLEVSPAAAEQLALAREVGTLQVALRGINQGPLSDSEVHAERRSVTRLNDTTDIFERQEKRPSNATVQTFLGSQQGQQTFGNTP